ncbi:hypothetical protein U469_09130 [Campylobacter coli K7]|nr:hypothetical protein U469_09130 [Campylobacter coli K7]
MIGRDFLYSIHKDKKVFIYFVKIKASLIVKAFMKNFIN